MATATQTIYNPDGTVKSVGTGQAIGSAPPPPGYGTWTRTVAPDGSNDVNTWANSLFAKAGIGPAASATGAQLSGYGMAGIAPPPAPAPDQPATAYAPAPVGMAGIPQSAPVASPAPSPAPSPAVSGNALSDVASWYRAALGRDPDQAGLTHWANLYTQQGPQAAYDAMMQSANQVQPGSVKPMTLGQASNYTGTLSASGNSVVDEWARNMYGRAATPQELQQFSGGDVQAQFEAFKTAAGTPTTDMTWFQASQLPTAQTQAGRPPAPGTPLGYGENGGDLPVAVNYQPNLNQQLTADQTIEGRINNLMTTDGQGNMTNPVVRQSVDRAMQSFASRGLLNTSMAVQAGQEAAISKAIEIAGPDAQRAFEQARANQDAQNVFARDEVQQRYTERNNIAEWAHDDQTQATEHAFRTKFLSQEQSFTLRQNYIEAQDHANDRYTQTVNAINQSNMTPEDKNIAIQQAAAVRDGELAYNNNLFAAQPTFAKEWLTMAVPTGGMEMGKVTNTDTLYNIINDPAQPADVRDAASARLKEVQAAGGAAAPDVAAQAAANTYTAYKAAGGTMTEQQWATAKQNGIMDGGQDANGSVTGGNEGDSVGSNANGDAAGVGAGPM